MTDDDKIEGRFSRWSKRKIAVAREEASSDEPQENPVVSSEEQAERDAELQAELQANCEAAEAVDLESLNEESDFSVFMKAGVPEMLKKQAMAALWRTSPIFANVDGLVDYGEDFANPDLNMKVFKSAYQAGRGYLDLFKEKEDATEIAEASDAENLEFPTEEISPNETVEAEVSDASGDEPDILVAAENEDALEISLEQEVLEPQPVQKVSLRRRLELERTV